MSLPSHKIKSLYKQGKFWSKWLNYIKGHNDRLLITILVWNNLVNVYAAALATQISIQIAESSWIEQSLAIWISTWIITFLILLFWEIIPKSFATKNAEKIALLVSWPYKILMLVIHPVVIFIETITKVFTWKNSNIRVSSDEIDSFIDLWKDTWSLEVWEYKRLKNTLRFNERNVWEIMVPRIKIEAIPQHRTIKEAKKFYMSHTHSRIPVYNRTIDKIVWILTVRDILKYENDKKLKDIKFEKNIKVPINQPIDNLLDIFQKTHRHIAVVMDEYGWVAGIITLEDIIEEIFWEIRDETDREVEDIKKIWDNAYLIKSDVLIDEVLDMFDLELKHIWLDKKVFSWENLSYILTHKLERFPVSKEMISFEIEWHKKSKIYKKIDFKILLAQDWIIWDVEVNISEKKW